MSAVVAKSVPVRKPRRPGYDIADAVARQIFDEHMRKSDCCTQSLFKFDKRASWMGIDKHKALIHSLLAEAKGTTPNQLSLHASLRGWLHDQGLLWCITDSDRAIMDLRGLVRRIVRYHRLARPVPRRFRHLEGLLLLCHADPPPTLPPPPQRGLSSHGADAAQSSSDEDAQIVDSLAPLVAPICDVSSESSSSSEVEITGVHRGPEVDMESLEVELFRVKRRKYCSKTAAADSSSGGVLSSWCSELELASLLEGAKQIEERAPTPRQYTKAFKMKKKLNKRPAARVNKSVDVTPAKKAKPTLFDDAVETPEKSSAPPAAAGLVPIDPIVRQYLDAPTDEKHRKRVHSNVWHRQMKLCKLNGDPPDKTRELASARGREAVRRWMELKASIA